MALLVDQLGAAGVGPWTYCGEPFRAITENAEIKDISRLRQLFPNGSHRDCVRRARGHRNPAGRRFTTCRGAGLCASLRRFATKPRSRLSLVLRRRGVRHCCAAPAGSCNRSVVGMVSACQFLRTWHSSVSETRRRQSQDYQRRRAAVGDASSRR